MPPLNQARVKTSTMRSRIRQYICEQIQSGGFKPGERIVETRLAKILSVSQAPVREAILELSVMGILEERPYSGAVVRRMTPEDIDDIYSMRAFVEECAATRAAKRITRSQLAAFEPVFDEMRRAAEAADNERFAECDIRFHQLVMEAAQSKTLLNMWRMLRLAEWTGITLKATRHSLAEITNTHEKILTHIKRGADHSAGAEMFLHIRGFADDLARYFEQNGHAGEAPDPGMAR